VLSSGILAGGVTRPTMDAKEQSLADSASLVMLTLKAEEMSS
jgi:hypothetical protein